MNTPIRQEEPAGCAVACVAFICETTYQKAKQFFKKQSAWGYNCREIAKALKQGGKNYSYYYCNGNKHFPANAIVFIKRSKKYPAGHYLVKTSKGWMDPWRNYPRTFPKAGYRKKLPGKAIYCIYLA